MQTIRKKEERIFMMKKKSKKLLLWLFAGILKHDPFHDRRYLSGAENIS